jgi:hypothetical protein
MTDDPIRLRDDVRRLELENASLRSALAQSVALVDRHGGAAALADVSAPPPVSAERRGTGRRLARILLVLAVLPTVYYLHVFDLAYTASYRQTPCIVAVPPAPGERAPTSGRPER